MFEGLFQPTHLILILVLALLIFGPSKLPQIGAGLGKSIRDFKKAMSDVTDDAPAKQLSASPTTENVATSTSTEAKKSPISGGTS